MCFVHRLCKLWELNQVHVVIVCPEQQTVRTPSEKRLAELLVAQQGTCTTHPMTPQPKRFWQSWLFWVAVAIVLFLVADIVGVLTSALQSR
jgi:hypothetical protein